MTVAEILNAVMGEYGARNQISQTQALSLLNAVQNIAFSEDIPAFMVVDNLLTISGTTPQGPYPFPITPPCRKFIGVTQCTPDQVLGIGGVPTVLSYYGPRWFPATPDNRGIYEKVLVKPLDRTFTFVDVPSTSSTFYQVYYRSAPTIRSALDDTNLLIPPAFHHTLCVQGCTALSDFGLYGTKAPEAFMEQFIRPFLDSMSGATDANGNNTISEGAW